MGMILVARSGKRDRSADAAHLHARMHANRRMRWRIACGLVLGVVASAALAVWLASPNQRTLAQIAALNHQVSAQRAELAQVRAGAQQDVARMAIKLGRLQAESDRLNALGQRLVAVGKLDPAEFNFGQAPGMGGPDKIVPPADSLPYDLTVSMDQLAQRFDTQQTQLGVLQSLFTDRKVAADLIPTGMPVSDGYISSPYGMRSDPFTGRRSFHPGLDIAVPRGSPVHAVAAGVVTYAGRRDGYGEVVEVDHGDGYMTRYAHNSHLLAYVGEHVNPGTVISDAGSTGRSTGPHVQFEVWHDGKLVNPIAYVRR